MTNACPCFGRNANCRLCNGTGLVTFEVEVKVARSQLPVKTSHYSGPSDAQKAIDAATKEAERAAYEAEQMARSIANWHKRFPNK